MNSVVALLFLGFAAIVSGSAVRSTSSGWGSPPAAIDIELSAELAAAAEGSASASQVVSESASGDASLSSENGIIAIVQQNGDITQVAQANTNDGSTQTVNVVNVSNDAAAADVLNASLQGSNSVAVANEGHTDASGWGALAAAASTINQVNTKKN